MDKCEWFPGGFQVVCHTTGKGPMGPMHGLGILSYNPMKKAYTYYGIDNMGMAEESKGNVDGNIWVYTSDEKMVRQDRPRPLFHGHVLADSYTFKYETSEDGQNWIVNMEGKTTKAGGAEKKPAAPQKKPK